VKHTELEKVVEICKTLECQASFTIGSDGKILSDVNFFDITREKLLKHPGIFDVGKLEKRAYDWTDDIDLIGPGFRINRYDTCKIVGYKEEIVPEHIRKIPVYNCNRKI
jgi:hypothetical protein